MANKSFEVLKPNFDEYKDVFMAMSGRLIQMAQGKEEKELRDSIDLHLDQFGADYPELITEYIVKRGMEALEV